ncbi:low affinity iron permease family protein [Amnibacterium sp. CER49]|uniref:low affinity iron permease family protein n=1 Tax=Amnibacterium sp. CER49 TaxID=3039161 RepID=UPI002449D11B|nr:low affinity iron permease family protein [Amnibacterium sp. CER49]MDH2443495.1 low affinity iron permease family protein [Amnibacterium sp. CER49]
MDEPDDDTPRWRRGLFRERRPPARSRSSLVLHRLGAASAHATSGIVVTAVVLVWILVGLAVGFSAWWENVLYVASSTVTLVMLFAIQHTQSRQQSALQLKLDEVLRSLPEAQGRLIAVEEAPDQELQGLTERSRDERTDALVTDSPQDPERRG